MKTQASCNFIIILGILFAKLLHVIKCHKVSFVYQLVNKFVQWMTLWSQLNESNGNCNCTEIIDHLSFVITGKCMKKLLI